MYLLFEEWLFTNGYSNPSFTNLSFVKNGVSHKTSELYRKYKTDKDYYESYELVIS